MSLPKSKILSVSKGFAAAAEIYNNSPNQTQILNVNINKEPEKEVVEESLNQNELKPDSKENEDSSELKLPDTTKDNIISAYALLLKIIESNPLIINKYIIAKSSELIELIHLLSESDTVTIKRLNDVSCNCFGASSSSAVDKIYITKNNETFNLKYDFPEVNKILDEHHINVKFVAD